MAIAAHQRVGDRLGAGGAIELGGGLLGLGHTSIIGPVFTTPLHAILHFRCKIASAAGRAYSLAKFGRVCRPRAEPRQSGSGGAPYFAAVIEATCIVLVFASSVPVTVTFLAANFSGVFWSLSV